MGGFCVATALDAVGLESGHHSIAFDKAAAGWSVDDRARDLGARAEGQLGLGLVGSGNNQGVKEVDAGSLDIDPDLVAWRGTERQILQVHVPGWPKLSDDPGPHGRIIGSQSR